ncbi:universal stress protein E [Escherichia coli]|uniref:Universal stress protein E n=1 Tax=Escherichia coli TaxID=562 RepID=A0A485JHC3_ECOLX|nr:universal stress protein E [Escherichia coli]
MTTLLSPDERTAMRQGVISQRTAWIHEQAKYYLMLAFPLKLKWSGITALLKPSFRK